MGRPRKTNSGIPKHIDQKALPKGVYWDGTGQGRWFTFELEDGRKRRKTIAGPAARLSELHAMVEDARDTGTVEWVCTQYHASAKFKNLARLTQSDCEYSRDVMLAFPTSLGVKFGQLKAAKLRNQHF